jgi:alpha/beta superfamily hydrolase
MSDSPEIQSCTLTTQDGVSLEAEVAAPAAPVAAALVCHPHPLYGGNMHNNVVGALFNRWRQANVATLRFNFRGSGQSEGTHGDGATERHDVRAAIDELSARHPGIPLIVAGYSFGADVSLAVTDDRPAAWLAVAPPLRVVPVEEMAVGPDPRPTVIVTGSVDDFRPPDQVTELTTSWQNTRLVVAEGTNHFFTTGLDVVTAAADELLQQLTV